SWDRSVKGRLSVEDTLLTGRGILLRGEGAANTLRLARCTLALAHPSVLRMPALPAVNPKVPAYRFEVEDSLLTGSRELFRLDVTSAPWLPPTTGRTWLKQLVSWKGRNNVLSAGPVWLGAANNNKPVTLEPAVGSLQEWGAFWGQGETGSTQVATG